MDKIGGSIWALSTMQYLIMMNMTTMKRSMEYQLHFQMSQKQILVPDPARAAWLGICKLRCNTDHNTANSLERFLAPGRDAYPEMMEQMEHQSYGQKNSRITD